MEHKAAGRIHPASAEGGCRDLSHILVVAAVSQELQGFRFKENFGVQRLITGMGQRAREAVRRRLSFGDVSLVISTGFAGGIRPGFEVGDLVMASEVIQASSGERKYPDPSFLGLNGLASVGPFVTVERVLSDPQAKSEAGVRFGAIAADMEAAAVAISAEAAGVAWVAVRAILDPMEFPLKISSGRQALRCLAAPGRWSEFSGFLKMIRTASRSLAEGLHLLISRAVIPAQSLPSTRSRAGIWI